MRFLILLLFVTNIYADVKQEMFGLYQNKKFDKVCTMGFNNLGKYKRDEEFISLYAFSCLNSDYIDRLARANSAYFAVILMQKKLLYHSLLDGYELHDKRAFYIFQDPKDKKLTYKLYLAKDYKITKMVIEEFYDTMLIKRHIYW